MTFSHSFTVQVDFITLVQAGTKTWVATRNAMLGSLAGTISAHGGESVRASDLLGFEARGWGPENYQFIVVQCGSMWFNVVQCGSMWFIMVHCGSMWFIMVHYYGSLWFIVVRDGSLIMVHWIYHGLFMMCPPKIGISGIRIWRLMELELIGGSFRQAQLFPVVRWWPPRLSPDFDSPKATFHCGSRKEMHDFEPKEASEAEKEATSFSKCVIDGAKKNKDGACRAWQCTGMGGSLGFSSSLLPNSEGSPWKFPDQPNLSNSNVPRKFRTSLKKFPKSLSLRS